MVKKFYLCENSGRELGGKTSISKLVSRSRPRDYTERVLLLYFYDIYIYTLPIHSTHFSKQVESLIYGDKCSSKPPSPPPLQQ